MRLLPEIRDADHAAVDTSAGFGLAAPTSTDDAIGRLALWLVDVAAEAACAEHDAGNAQWATGSAAAEDAKPSS